MSEQTIKIKNEYFKVKKTAYGYELLSADSLEIIIPENFKGCSVERYENYYGIEDTTTQSNESDLFVRRPQLKLVF